MPGGNSETVKVTTMTTSEKFAAKIAPLIKQGEIDPSKINRVKKKVGVSLNLSEEQLSWAALVYTNHQEFINK